MVFCQMYLSCLCFTNTFVLVGHLLLSTACLVVWAEYWPIWEQLLRVEYCKNVLWKYGQNGIQATRSCDTWLNAPFLGDFRHVQHLLLLWVVLELLTWASWLVGPVFSITSSRLLGNKIHLYLLDPYILYIIGYVTNFVIDSCQIQCSTSCIMEMPSVKRADFVKKP